jgi:hypothetical protein
VEQSSRHAGSGGDGILRKDIDDELQSSRIADLDERRARVDDTLALAENVKHLTVDGGGDLELFGRPRTRRKPFEGRSGLLDIVGGDLLGETCRRKFGPAHASVGRCLVELRLGERSLLGQGIHSRKVAASRIVRRLCACHGGIGLPLRVDRGGQVLHRHLTRSWIEQRARERQKSSQHHPGFDAVSFVQIDPRERSRHGRRHRVALANAGAAVVYDLLVERLSNDGSYVHVEGARAQGKHDPREQRSGEYDRDDPKWPFHGSNLSREP